GREDEGDQTVPINTRKKRGLVSLPRAELRRAGALGLRRVEGAACPGFFQVANPRSVGTRFPCCLHVSLFVLARLFHCVADERTRLPPGDRLPRLNSAALKSRCRRGDPDSR